MTRQLSLGAVATSTTGTPAGERPMSLRPITIADERFVRRKVNRALGSPPFPFAWVRNVLIGICGDTGSSSGTSEPTRKRLASVGIYPGAEGWQVDDLRPWLIGENNPYQNPGADPTHRFDLYPEPRGATGDRLCRLVFGMQKTDYLRAFVRRDLLEGKWTLKKARAAAEQVLIESGTTPLILLGSKVSAAFGLKYIPYSSIDHGTANGIRTAVILPHPSGLNPAWNEPGAYQRARDLVLPLLAHAPESPG